MFVTFIKRILLIAAGLSLFSSLALAQAAAAPPNTASASAASSAPAPAGPGRVGIVNIQDAIVATNEGKREFDALQARFSPKQAELKTLNDEVEGLKKDLQTQGDKLSEDARATRVKTLETKQKTLQRNYDDAQSEFQQAEQEVVNRIGGKMLNVMEKYAKAHGYALILDVSNPQTPVLYFSEGTNITKELVEAYNAESPVAPPAPAAKTSSAPASRPAAPAPATTPKKP